MIPVMSDIGKKALRDFFIIPTTLFAFDLDGTLAPLAGHPADILIPAKIREQLIHLNQFAPVAVITGRGRADALSHLGFNPRFLIGNHGAEGLPGQEAREAEDRRLCQNWETQLRATLPLDASGILFENKGTSLSLHYRGANGSDIQRRILEAIDHLTPPPRRVAGKFVENLVPVDSPNKGQALLTLMHHLHCNRAIFIGDDVTDEDVFCLQEEKDAAVFGIRVGKDPASAAAAFLETQEQIEQLLEIIVEIRGANSQYNVFDP